MTPYWEVKNNIDMLSNLSVCFLVASYTRNYNGLGSLQELKVVIGCTQRPEACTGSLDFSGNPSRSNINVNGEE